MSLTSDPPLLKQEKTFGYILGGLALAAGGVGFYFLLPFLLTMAFGALQLAIIGGSLYAAWMVFTSDLVRTHGAKIFRMMVRRTSRIFMSYDPIGALQDHVIYLRQCLGKFDQKRNQLSGIIESVKEQIEKSRREYTEAMRLAKKAQDMSDVQTLNLEGRKAKRRKDTVERLEKIFERLSTVLKTLHKLREHSQFLILDTEDEVNEMMIRHGAMNAAGAALEEALKVIEGDPEMQAMYKDTMRALEESVRERVGLIEMVMTNADGLIGGIDVKNATINEQILHDLEAWDSRSNELLLRPDKERASSEAPKSALREALSKSTQKTL